MKTCIASSFAMLRYINQYLRRPYHVLLCRKLPDAPDLVWKRHRVRYVQQRV